MIEELTWDSAFFKKKIGSFTIGSSEPSDIFNAIDKARAEGFRYITCKLTKQDTGLIRLLGSSGFYLTDIGVIMGIETNRFSEKSICKDRKVRETIKMPTYEDIPILKRMVKSLFTESRFYHDPFYSKEDADRLYMTWVENSVKGQAADMVFFIPKTGFITCRRSGRHSGEIVLVGIRKGLRGKGFGRALIEKAMTWFIKEKVTTVTVRTQLKNLNAVNFYFRMGFSLREYDIIFGKIL